MGFYFLCNFFCNFSHSQKNRARYDKNVYWLSFKEPPILVHFFDTEFSRQFSKNIHTPNFIEIHPVGAELLHADGQTDKKKKGKKEEYANIRMFAILHS